MLNVVMLYVSSNPFMLSVVILNVVMLNVLSNPFMLSVVRTSVIMLSVVAPLQCSKNESFSYKCSTSFENF